MSYLARKQADMFALTGSWEEKEMSTPSRYVKGTEKEFVFFGTGKPIISGMHRLCFLSEAPWEIVIFVFIYFILCLFYFFMLLVCFDRLIGLVVRVFANGLGDLSSIPGRIISKTLKMVLDTSLLNTKQYKVCIKGSGAILGKE